MAQSISLTVRIYDGTVQAPAAKFFMADSIEDYVASPSGGSYADPTVNSLVMYRDISTCVKAYYVTDTVSEINTKLNA